MAEIAEWDRITTTIPDWSSFVQYVARHCAIPSLLHGPAMLFRGLGNRSWDLRPTMARILPARLTAAEIVDVEDKASALFESSHLLDAMYPTRSVEAPTARRIRALVLMRHHGGPTRLLDWSASPYVAAYFASVEQPDLDGVIYLAHAYSVNNHFGAQFESEKREQGETAPSVAPFMFIAPPVYFERLAVQQGHFSIARDGLADHAALLMEAAMASGNQEGEVLARWVLPARLKREFLRQLRMMNVTGQALFPGLDGLGRSVSERVASEIE